MLEAYRVILASKSPRRKELLGKLLGGDHFEILPAVGPETKIPGTPEELVIHLAYTKAREVFDRLTKKSSGEEVCRSSLTPGEAEEACMTERKPESGEAKPVFVIGADTIVVKDGEVLGKPKDTEDAARMLTLLQGTVHEVYTGVSLLTPGREPVKFMSRTLVRFYPMDEEEIRAYIATGDPMDKAGAYGIQGPCGKHIAGIEGDYDTVVGFPTALVYRKMKELTKEENG